MIETRFRNLKFLKWIYVFSFSLNLLSCAPPPDSKNMVPYLDYSNFENTGYSIKLSSVIGSVEKDKTVSKINNESFYLALKETIKRTNLFEEVEGSKDYDFRLDTKIISQKLQPGITAFAALYVSYSLVDSSTGLAVWEENIFTQIDAFGANQGKDALESAARANLEQLIDKILIFFENI